MKISFILAFIGAAMTMVFARRLEEFQSRVVRNSKPLTNAERIKRGLPPARPRNLYTPDRVGAAPRPRISPGFNYDICSANADNGYTKAGCCVTVHYETVGTLYATGCGMPLAVNTPFECQNTKTSVCCTGDYSTDSGGTLHGCVAVDGSLNGL
ncbi:hypothetical protein FRB90_002647 [Tulasnella sp. 427]|nr:hypothetical protein FRB90_002647 [Tulasnella sp. 427]